MRNLTDIITGTAFKVVLFFLTVMAIPFSALSESNRSTPDFAFPATVEKDADSQLEEALKKGDDVEALRAAIDVIVARNLISHSSLQENITLLDSITPLLKEPFSALSSLLKANLYVAQYESSPWVYNRRTTSSDSEGPEGWDTSRFASETLSAVKNALKMSGGAGTMGIETISPVIDNIDDSGFMNLTVYDFIVYKGAACLKTFCNPLPIDVIPFFKGAEPLSPSDECSNERDLLLAGLISAQYASENMEALALSIVIKSEDMNQEERIAFLNSWYRKLNTYPASGRLLHTIFQNRGMAGSLSDKKMYEEMSQWLKDFHDTPYNEIISDDLNLLSAPSISLNVPTYVLPHTPFRASGSMANINDGFVLIYRLSDDSPSSEIRNIDFKKFPQGATLCGSLSLTCEGCVPFENEVHFEIPSLAPGLYVALPSLSPSLSKDWGSTVEKWSVSTFRVTDLAIITLNDNTPQGKTDVYVVDAQTQKPIEGAAVTFIDESNKKNRINKSTDAEGRVALPEGYYRVEARKGNSRAYVYAGSRPYIGRTDSVASATILTDLSVYRPGDEMEFAVCAWKQVSLDYDFLRHEKIEIVLRDANYTERARIEGMTDDTGRFAGRITVPTDGLQGNWRLEAHSGGIIGSCEVLINDYKIPTFYIETDFKSGKTYKPGDPITLKGRILTYSGMPVTDANITLTVDYSRFYRWRNAGNEGSFNMTVKGDENGCFSIFLPTDNLRDTRFSSGLFMMTLETTSPAGETVKSPLMSFSLGNISRLNPEIADKICVDGDSLVFKVAVNDAEGFPVVSQVAYKLRNLNDSLNIKEGRFESPLLSLPSSSLPSGKYELTFAIPGDTVRRETVIYRIDDSRPPVTTPLWVPESEILFEEGIAKVEVSVGSSYPSSFILCIVSDGEEILSRQWLKIDEENLRIKVPVEGVQRNIFVSFSGMHDFDREVATVSLIPRKLKQQMNVRVESLTSKVSAGENVKWKFFFDVADVLQDNIPVIATMSDKALNAISPFHWSFPYPQRLMNRNVFINGLSQSFHTVIARYGKSYRYPPLPGGLPQWQTYGYSLAGNMGFDAIPLLSMKRSAGAIVTESMSLMAKNEMADEADMESPHSITEGYNDADASGNVSEDIIFHPSEMPSAFFMPLLHTDNSGEVEIALRMPDFNTTWQLQVLGYNADLLSAIGCYDITASKPVMVKTNFSLYARTGDYLVIPGNLFNNTTDSLAIGGKIEIIDAVSGIVLADESFAPEATPPSRNRLIETGFTVPASTSLLRIRVSANSADFSDGEETFIPVYPSSIPVIESRCFYLDEGNASEKIVLPSYSGNANLTLKYCMNPLGEGLLALPTDFSVDSPSILQLAQSIASAATAVSLINKNPEIKRIIENCSSSADSLIRISNLQKDENLKNVTLINTPWVNDAAAETERLANLSSLLDYDTAVITIENMLQKLQTLQHHDGGWSWTDGMRSSLFVTVNVLQNLSLIRRANLLSGNYNKMIEKAIGYCDDQYLRQWKETGHINSRGILNYLSARTDIYGTKASPSFSSLRDKALDEIEKDWKKYDIIEKADVAILFHNLGRNQEICLSIINSLTEYAKKDGAKGWWFDNVSSPYSPFPRVVAVAKALEATSMISSDDAAVRGYRQWLLMQKETENWGASNVSSMIVNAIVSSYRGVFQEFEMPEIWLDGEKIEIPVSMANNLSLTLNLNPSQASKKTLVVTKKGNAPAWGGVISQYVAPVATVKADKGDNLRIEKNLLKINGDGTMTKVDSENLRSGDKVRIQLSLVCGKDMEYVALTDQRSCALQPDSWHSGYQLIDGLWGYRETTDNATNFFLEFLPKGTHIISYDCYVDREGEYSLGIASAQSLYSPIESAHSKGSLLIIR